MLEEKLKGRSYKKMATQKWAITLLASSRYMRYLTITTTGNIKIDRKAITLAAKSDGKWVTGTNDDQLILEDAAHGYRNFLVIERCFRSLKRTQIKMIPMYHWLPERIESPHVKICVLALLIEQVVELKCCKPWSKI